MKLIDTHFHLDHYSNHEYWYKEINKLEQYTLCVTNTPEIYYSCIKLYRESKYIKFALGFNPQQIKEVKFNKRLFLHQLSSTKYIGEVGLDFSKKYIDTKNKQMEVFDFICKESAAKHKILSVHVRNSEKEAFDIMKKNNVTKAIIHWYSGSIKMMQQYIDAGYYFSVNANMCMTNNGKRIISAIPIDRLLVESDGPYTKVETLKYKPTFLCKTYALINSIINEKDFERIIFENFHRLLSNT